MTKLLFVLLILISFKSIAVPHIEGLIELEGFHHIDNNSHTNEFNEPTIELLSHIPVSKAWNGTIALLHEDGTALDVDEAYISYTKSFFSFRAGKTILPLLKLETGLISDPLTLELFEQHTTIIESRIKFDNFSLSGILFKGRGSNNKVKSILFGANYHNSWLEVGSSFISDITFTDFLSTIGTFKQTGAITLTLSVVAKNLKLIFEGVAAVDYVINDKRPTAHQIELSYTLPSIAFISSLQGTSDINDLPKTRFLTGVQIPLNKNVTTSIEYSWDKSANSDKSQVLTGQLALTF